jgi:hypothetical protein
MVFSCGPSAMTATWRTVFAVQDEIARSIADRLKVTLKGDQQPLVDALTDNLEAYQLYLKGRALFYQRGTRSPRSLECFERSVAMDEKYALAWAALADTTNMLAWYGFARPQASLPMRKKQRHVRFLRPLPIPCTFTRALSNPSPSGRLPSECSGETLIEPPRRLLSNAVCGECDPPLWKLGNGHAAIRLEQLWNAVAKVRVTGIKQDIVEPSAHEVRA